MNLEQLKRLVAEGESEPEFEERAGQVIVRFIPSGYTPPHRVSHDLTERQRRVLHILRDGKRLRAGEIRSQLAPIPSATVLRDDLNLLRDLGLIEGTGHGAGARWWLQAPRPGIERNRTE